jgi:hypothetical protein
VRPAHLVWLYDGFAVSGPPQAIVVRGSLTILEKSYAKAASLFVHPPTATDRIQVMSLLYIRPTKRRTYFGLNLGRLNVIVQAVENIDD